MSAICIIPARGGSTRIPRKNIRLFHGKPIIAYSIECAIAAQIFERIVVSTEDPEIAGIANSYGAAVYARPGSLALNEIGTQAVMAYHALDDRHLGVHFDYSCCLYATAPMLEPRTLRAALQLLEGSASAYYTVPVGTWLRDPGQFYFGHTAAFADSLPLLSPFTQMMPIDPKTECDINTEQDWIRAEAMYAERRRAEIFARARA